MARRDPGQVSDQAALERPIEGLALAPRLWVPAAFVLFSLFALLLAPLLLGARAASLRTDVVNPGSDARGEINDVRHAVTSGEAAIRGLLLTGEERFLASLLEAQREQRIAFERLTPLARTLDPDLVPMVEALRARSDRASRDRVALLDDLRAGRVPADLLAREEERHESLIHGADSIKAEIVARTEHARAEIRRLEQLDTLLTIVLALLALVSAGLVLRTSRAHRLRAREEAQLRAAAFSLSEATRVGDVLRRIAYLAARIDRGESSYVERIVHDSHDVEIVAGVGPAAPAIGVRVPYPGSLTHEVVSSGAPEIVPDIGRLDRPISRILAASCTRCVALVVPLVADRTPEGALVIIRPEGTTFSEREVEQRRALGVLAALTLRKTVLLEQARSQHEALQSVVESRERLIRGFSHDVKNPLGAADGHAQLLADGILGEITPRQTESVQRIRSGIASALGLINNLIDLARSEAGELELRMEPVDIAAVADETAHVYGAVADAVGLHLETDLEPDLPTVRSDAERIAQVLGNLLSNAIKYTPPGGTIRLTADARTGRSQGDPSRWVTLAVHDTGPGIPPEEHETLFNEFRRLDPDSAQGEGLGLAISDRVARLLGGEITLDSTVGRGSTFTLWLPDGNHATHG